MSRIIAKGTYGIINYTIEQDLDAKTYLVEKNKELLSYAYFNFSSFINNKVPKFGKYEIEEFVANIIVLALIKGDLTDLMNINISYYDFPYNDVSLAKEIIKKRILGYCEIVEENNNVVKLRYLGKKSTL